MSARISKIGGQKYDRYIYGSVDTEKGNNVKGWTRATSVCVIGNKLERSKYDIT